VAYIGFRERGAIMARMPQTPDASLTPKQRQFVNEYLVDLNATQAAIRAGYDSRTAAGTVDADGRRHRQHRGRHAQDSRR